MNHEQQPPGTTPQPDERRPEAETAPVPGTVAGDSSEALPDSEHSEQRQDIAPPRIWVGSLSDYNNGHLYGAWIDAAREPEAIQTDIQTMLAGSPWTARTGEPAEEWGIFDFDNFGACRIDQHEDLAWVSGVAQGIAEHGLAFAAWADVVEEPALLQDFEEAYIGEYDSLEAYAEEVITELGYDELLDQAVPASLRPYVRIDVAGMARDLQLAGDLYVVRSDDGGVWIFNAN